MYRKLGYLLSLVLVLGLLPSGGLGQENILVNGEFDEGLFGWEVPIDPAYDVRVVRDAELSGDRAVVVDVMDAVSADAIYFSQRIPNLVSGRAYPLSFIAKAETPRDVNILMEVYTPDRGAWGAVLLTRAVRVTETPQLFTIQYTHLGETLSEHPAWTANIYWFFRRVGIPIQGADLNAKVWLDRIDLGGQPPPFDPALARSPVPADGASDVRRDVVLRWTPGNSASTHDVYFGTSLSSVSAASRFNTGGVLVSRGQITTTYEVGGQLDLDRTYYWRVDGVQSNGAVLKGNTWSFTAEPLAYPIADVTATASHADPGRGAEHTVDGSGLNDIDQHSTWGGDMWQASPGFGQRPWIRYQFDRVYKLHEVYVWNYNAVAGGSPGYGARNVTVEYSDNGANWTVLRDVELNQAPGHGAYACNNVVSFGGVTARYVQLRLNSNWGGGGSYGLSEVRFLCVPMRAHGPLPHDGEADVDRDTVLSWRPGREALSHHVYLSTSPSAVAGGAAHVATAYDNAYDPGRLDLGTVYYWRIDELGSSGTWAGDTWSFSTEEYALIDGFEDYTDNVFEAETIWQTWIDGLDNPDNGGAIVGYEQSPFAEQTIVHRGEQSLPLAYDNSAWPYYSRISRTWTAAQNWTAGAADTLRLYFYGREANAPERLYVAVRDNAGRFKAVRHPDPAAARTRGWQVWTIPFSEFAAAGVNITSVSTLYIGLGDPDSPSPGGGGLIFIDDVAIGSPVN